MEASPLNATIELFEFLRERETLKAPSVSTVDAYKKEPEWVTWRAEIPEHDAVSVGQPGDEEDDESPILVVDRVPREEAPEPSESLRAWLRGPIDRPDTEPDVYDRLPRRHVQEPDHSYDVAPDPDEEVEIDDQIMADFVTWLDMWRRWASRELYDRPVRDLYNQLFSAYQTVLNHSDEYELVLALGLLQWKVEDNEIRRHLFTRALEIDHDDETGRLKVRTAWSTESLRLETEMINPAYLREHEKLQAIRQAVADYDGHLLDSDAIGSLARRFVHVLDASGRFVDDDAGVKPDSSPVVSLSPAFIMRKSTKQGLINIFESIVTELRGAEDAPKGLIPLVDPDHELRTAPDSTPGAITKADDDDELFLPLPTNSRQRKVIERVDQRAQTVVQGPPGTGKTHTAAVLISHLLAQGKRVLVTAQTDRALEELRDKVPTELQPLTVSVVGGSRSSSDQLAEAVEAISAKVEERDDDDYPAKERKALEAIDELKRARAKARRDLIDARQAEEEFYDKCGYTGTVAEIARQHQERRREYGWIEGLVDARQGSPAPLDSEDAERWLELLRDREIEGAMRDAELHLPDLSRIPEPEEFDGLVAELRRAEQSLSLQQGATGHAQFPRLRVLSEEELAGLDARLAELQDELAELGQRPEVWMAHALTDLRDRRSEPWLDRAESIREGIEAVREPLDRLGTNQVEVGGAERGTLVGLATSLRRYLSEGGEIETKADGSPRIPKLGRGRKVLKEARPFLEVVRVNQMVPATTEALDLFLAWHEADQKLEALRRAWPSSTAVPNEDTHGEVLAWHVTELKQLERLLELDGKLGDTDSYIRSLALLPPEWSDEGKVAQWGDAVKAARAEQEVSSAREAVKSVEEVLGTAAQLHRTPSCVSELREAIERRDSTAYRLNHGYLRQLHAVRDRLTQKEELTARLSDAAPQLADAVMQSPFDDVWSARLHKLEEAWNWATVGAWVDQFGSRDVNILQTKLASLEGSLNRETEKLAAIRAWGHAVSPDRVTGRTQADLATYVQRVRRYGKGTGRYSTLRKADMRKAMERCWSAVPAWVMPLYRIAEQFRAEQDMFDVVIVDEASQAGTEAAFLHYLAPKTVVIGDDQQVSPDATGVNRQEMRDLADKHLANHRYKTTWQDPEQSLFDIADAYYGGRIRLTEHRRCMPEIIGFSNRIAYEGSGERLIPVREFGADRLKPIEVRHIEDGYEEGDQRPVNPPEQEAIIEQIKKCLADPRYRGMTFGVISLLGPTQAKQVESRLMEELGDRDWRERELRCGDAADFQGAERDVVFLSMVKSPQSTRSIGPLTTARYVRRYNVAVSRAKDQVWLFHSVTGRDLSRNARDMRFALLDYAYSVAAAGETSEEGVLEAPVRDGIRDDRFDSLFEQRVANDLVERGYDVKPQKSVGEYRIDLVVIGQESRLAVECDGDHWHGPERYASDMARQRELERCGWKFFRLRESAYYVNRRRVLLELEEALENRGIEPRGRGPRDVGDEVEDAGQGDEWRMPNVGEARHAWGSGEEGQESWHGMPDLAREDASAVRADGGPGKRDGIEVETKGEESAARPDRSGIDEDAGSKTVAGRSGIDREEGGPAPDARRSRSGLDQWEEAGVRETASNGGFEPAWAAGRQGYRDVSNTELRPYKKFTGVTVPTSQAGQSEVIRGLLEIVEAEGPVVGTRLQKAYVQASGGRRVGRDIARELDRAISHAVKSEELVVCDPLDERDLRLRTYRLPDQPSVVERDLGPRDLHEVPPLELAAVMSGACGSVRSENPEALFRCVLERLGLKRLTGKTRRRLEAVSGLLVE